MDWLLIVLGIFTGIVSSIIYTAIMGQFNLWRKFIPTNLRKSVSWEYKNQQKAEKSIIKDIKCSKSMRVFTLKCSTFCDKFVKYDNLYKALHRNDINIKQKYLVSSIDNPYIPIRVKELNESLNTFKNGIQAVIEHLSEEKTNEKNGNVDYRLHNEIVRFRLIIFDDNLYLSYQSSDSVGRESPMQRYPKGSSGYCALEAYFDELWHKYENNGEEKND